MEKHLKVKEFTNEVEMIDYFNSLNKKVKLRRIRCFYEEE